MYKVDNIVVGSSPISLTKAAILQSKGESVLVIDCTQNIGGAWKTVRYNNTPEVEIGCHIWSYHKVGYDLINRLFELNMNPLDPQPLLKKGRITIPYDLKNTFISARDLTKASLKFNSRAVSSVKNNPSFRISLISPKFQYLNQGAKELLPAIHNFVKKHDLQILLDTRVEKVELTGSQLQISTNSEQESFGSIDAKRIWFTSLTNITDILINNKPFKLSQRQESYIHFHLLFKNQPIKSFSYHRVLDHPLIHRVSDMSAQIKNEPETGESLISVAVFKDAFNRHSPSDLEELILDFLVAKKYIDKNNQIVAINHNKYDCTYNNRSQLNQLKKYSNGAIDFIHSTDFVYSFVNLQNEIEELLNQDS